MLKTAVYGLLRVTLRPAATQLWWWGVLLLAIGLATALFGVIFAAVQTDMKRLLAYSSIENIGLHRSPASAWRSCSARTACTPLAALALTAALYHVANHAFFKSLLFLGTGCGAARDRRAQPRQARRAHPHACRGWPGSRSSACWRSPGLPPLERLRLRMAAAAELPVHAGVAATRFSTCWCRSAAALIALAAALAGYTMVKFYGVIFLGQPREESLREAHDAGAWERARHRVARRRLRRARVVAGAVHPAHRSGHAPAGRRRHRRDRSRANGWLLAPVDARAGELRADDLPARRRGAASCSPSCWCARSITAACAARRRGTAASPGRPRACRTRPKASASRSGRSSSRSSASQRECPRLRRAAALPRRASRTILALALPAGGARWSSALARWSACCSRGGSPSTCCTASSR